MKSISTLALLLVLGVSSMAQDAEQLVSEMITAIGGKENFYKLKNVNYDYTYSGPNGTSLKSHETYVFNHEKSHADYSEHSIIAPNGGKVIEGYDGSDAWVTIDGQLSENEQANGTSRFLRKTNYYWFTMYFKLLDSGVNHEYLGNKKVDGKNYDLVKITFGDDVGDAQDTYVLYINKETKLVDQFLFTVMGMGATEPFLMKMDYETIDGIKIGSERKYIEADWDGTTKGKKWTTTDWTNIEFNTAIDTSMFEKRAAY